MDDNTACVLRTILRHYPCTKLCVKQHSGLSMSAVLRAVEALRREGWIAVEAHAVPQGGKPHADIRPTARPVYGAHKSGNGWTLCALRLTGETETVEAANLPNVRPLSVVCDPHEETSLPLLSRATSEGEALAAYLAMHDQGVYVDENLRLYVGAGAPRNLGDLPSPLLDCDRLSFREAFKRGSPQQKIRLKAELSLYIKTILHARGVVFADGLSVPLAQAAAWEAMRHLVGYL